MDSIKMFIVFFLIGLTTASPSASPPTTTTTPTPSTTTTTPTPTTTTITQTPTTTTPTPTTTTRTPTTATTTTKTTTPTPTTTTTTPTPTTTTATTTLTTTKTSPTSPKTSSTAPETSLTPKTPIPTARKKTQLPEPTTQKPTPPKPTKPKPTTPKPTSPKPTTPKPTSPKPTTPKPTTPTSLISSLSPSSSNATIPSVSPTTPPATSASPTTPPQLPNVRVSETNLLLQDTTGGAPLFVEISGNSSSPVVDLVVVILDIYKVTPLTSVTFTHTNNITLLENGTNFNISLEAIRNVHSVGVLLYKDQESANKTTAEGLIDVIAIADMVDVAWQQNAMREELRLKRENQLIYIGNTCRQHFEKEHMSLSRCSHTKSNAGLMLTPSSPGVVNMCVMPYDDMLQMALTKSQSSKAGHQDRARGQTLTFQNELTSELLDHVGTGGMCGLSWLMFKDITVTDNGDVTQVQVHLQSTMTSQLGGVIAEFSDFVTNQNVTLTIQGVDYMVSNCTDGDVCVSKPLHKPGTGDSIRVTYGVVFSCIAAFVVIVVMVVLYMRRKSRGILQFRMTRLDDYDDELIGDMEDFVGSDDPTFRR